MVACMAVPALLAKLKEGVEVWNRWREQHPVRHPDLSGAELFEADLVDAHLAGADLRGADLRRAHISGANLDRAQLRGAELLAAALRGPKLADANLYKTDFTEAILSGANLSGANLRGAQLRSANFDGADLTGTNLADATIGWTIFADTNLSGAKGLESCMHVGPSSIGPDTFFKSGGDIPDGFLRGCGVPEQFITYARSLVGQPIEFYSCFISYSSHDQAFAERLHADLRAQNLRCWFAPHDIQGGRKVHEQIDEAIRIYDRLLLILSEASMRSSWVETEISKARNRELRESRRMLFPVRLVEFEALRDWQCFDADTGKDSAREIREYFIPDFSRWKEHDEYKKAFDRLLRDLKSKNEAPRKPA